MTVEEFPGLHSIVDGNDLWNHIVPLEYDLVYANMKTTRDMSRRGLAMIPYCICCKVPVNWIRYHDTDLYRCPKCQRLWIKGNGFNCER